MKRILIVMILIACPVMTFAQTSATAMSGGPALSGSPLYQPGMPAHYITGYEGYGWDWDDGRPQTPEGAALQGASQVIGAVGQYNLATSAAAINVTQAYSNALRNQIQAAHTMWEVADFNAMERGRHRPRATPEELARRARAASPRALSANQMDRVSGELYWLVALLDDRLLPQRIAVDECAARWARYGGLDYDDQVLVRENIDTIYRALKSRIKSIPPQEYVESRSFLQSLLYATTRSII